MEWLLVIGAALLIASKIKPNQSPPIPSIAPDQINIEYMEPYRGQDLPGDVLLSPVPLEFVPVSSAPPQNEIINNGSEDMDLLTLGLLGGAAYLGYKAMNKEQVPPAVTNSYIAPVEQIPGSTGTPVINDPYAEEPPYVDDTSNYDASVVLPQGGVTVGQIFGENPPSMITTYASEQVEQQGGIYDPTFVKQMVDWGQWDPSVLEHFMYWASYWAKKYGDASYTQSGGVNGYLNRISQVFYSSPYMGD